MSQSNFEPLTCFLNPKPAPHLHSFGSAVEADWRENMTENHWGRGWLVQGDICAFEGINWGQQREHMCH